MPNACRRSDIRHPGTSPTGGSHIVRRVLLPVLALLLIASPAYAQISISGVTPDSGWGVEPPLNGVQEFTINGSFPFPGGMTVALSRSGQPDIAGSDVAWVSPTSIECTLALVSAAPGRWDVQVTHNHFYDKGENKWRLLYFNGNLAYETADLNNILQAIYGHTDAGLDLACGHGERVEALKAVRTAAEKAAALIGQLLAFSRRQVIDYKIIDLNALINNLLKMLRRVIGEHVDLRFAPCHDPAVIIADPGQVEQVLMNLCVNARDSMPSGGTITIETCPNGGDDVFDADQDRPAEGWRMFSVTDTGSGMNKEVRSKAFEPFFTTKEMGRGTGLGLATVHGIIKQHDGLIELDSEPGRGTQFRVYLPGSSQRPEGVKTREKRPSRGGAETILVAEDDDAIREIAQNVLESVGYTVYVAADGQEAVDVFKAHADEISLALLDAVMPKLGGHEVRTQIRALRPDVRILYNSGYDPDVYPDLFRVDQSVRILQKPYDLDTLLQAVRGLLDE